jgi:hypothetical protein
MAWTAKDFETSTAGKWSAADFDPQKSNVGRASSEASPKQVTAPMGNVADFLEPSTQKRNVMESRLNEGSAPSMSYEQYKNFEKAATPVKAIPELMPTKPVDIRDTFKPVSDSVLKSGIGQFSAGIAESSIPRAVSSMQKISSGKGPGMDKYVEASKPYSNAARIAGNITGELAGNALTYGIAGKAIGGTKAIGKIANPLLRNVIAGQLADTAIQTPLVVAEGVANKRSAGEILGNVGKQQAWDLAGNIAFAGAEGLIKGIASKLKVGKALTPQEVETVTNATKQIGGNADESIDTQAKRLDEYFQNRRAPDTSIGGNAPKTEPQGRIFGEQPKGGIPEGMKERGFSRNIRTDEAMPDDIRMNFDEDPLTYKQITNDETLKKAQSIFAQGEEPATAELYRSLGSKEFRPESVPLSKLIAKQAMESGNVEKARQVLSETANRLTEAGQFSQAAKILRESDPETFLMTIDKQLKKLNREGLETYGKKWKDFDLTPGEIDMVSKIERGNQASYESAFEAIQKRIANEMPASAMEKVNAWRHMSMLLNLKTHIRNVTGNAIMMGMRKVAQRVSGVGQKLLKAEDRTQAVFINREYRQAAKDYFEANKKDLLSGANKYNENLTLNMPDKRVFKNNALDATRRLNYKLLELGDTPFFKNAYVDRLASYAQAKGIKDFSQLGQEAFDIAKKEAEQATYKDASVIASFLNKIKHPGRNASFGQRAAGVLTEAALPFTKTPINIIKRGIQYSPAGIINGLSKIKSSDGAAAAIDEMAKGLTGTGILGLGYLLASKGILTGKAENDKDLADYNKNTGNSPFSILGKYSYDWAQPFAVPLTVGVEIYNAVKDSPEDAKKLDALIEKNDTTGLQQMAQKFAIGMLDSFNASGDTVFNMSFMKGIRQLLGSGTQGVMEGLAQLPMNYAMQYIPTILNQTAGQIDPIVRQSYFKGNAVESAKAAALSKIPFASKTLQPKQTPWGQDVKRVGNPWLRAFSQFASPGIITVPQNIDEEVDTELRRLNKMGETIQFPRVASNSFTWKGQKFNLTPEEYTTFQKTLGQNTLTAYKEYIKTPEYKALDDSDKAKELSNIITDAQDLARFQVIQSKGMANSPEIMDVPNSFTNNKVQKEMTFEQQNELADLINKYKKLYSQNNNMPAEHVDKKARERANIEMKRKLFRN